MAPAVPGLGVVRVHQPHVRLMHQRSRLQGLTGLLVGEASGGELAELVIHKREQLGCGLGVAGLGRGENLGDVCHER